jgi:hypothetical protein
MKILIRVLLLFFLVQIDGCKWFTNAGTPYFKWTSFKIPQGTPAFQAGYKDGCSTVLYARGNVYYRTRYSYRYDPKMIGNPEYRFGHSRGYAWCFQQVVAGTSGPVGSFDKYLNPGGYDSTFSAGNINDAWGGMFSGTNQAGLDAPIKPNPANGFDAMFDVWSGGASGSVFGANPLWAGGSKGQFFGQ